MEEIISNYEKLCDSMSILIEKSGYRNNFLAGKLGIPTSNFSTKKKKGSWTPAEMKSLIRVIESDELDDYFMGLIMDERKGEETINHDEAKKIFGWN
jgi:hypothetical protein